MNKILTIIFIALWANNVGAVEPIVIPKSDTAAMFTMSLEAWKKNVIGLQNANLAQYDTNGTDEYTLIYETDLARIITTPAYKQENTKKPWKVSLAILYYLEGTERFNSISKDNLKKFIGDIYEEMLPEFTVYSLIKRSKELVIQEHQIFEYGSDKIGDEYGAKNKGCFKDCIQDFF